MNVPGQGATGEGRAGAGRGVGTLRRIRRLLGAAAPGEEGAAPSRPVALATLGLRLVSVAALGVVGWVLVTDRPGLETQYFALGEPWRGSPVGRAVTLPDVRDTSDVGRNLLTPVLYSVRWRGWIDVEEAGEHLLIVDADDGAYLRLDGRPVVDLEPRDGGSTGTGRVVLRAGLRRLEVGLVQRAGDAHLTLRVVAPGRLLADASALPAERLFAGRPLLLRRALRAWVGDEGPGRTALGVFCLVAALALGVAWAPRGGETAERLRALVEPSRALGQGPLLPGLAFAVTFAAVFPYTGTVIAGDDTSYLDTATFDVETWYIRRYAHVYLLKLFVLLAGGDPLLGVRLWWSFVMAGTVAALAVGVRSLGSGLQLRSLAASCFALCSIPVVWGLIGAGFADFSTMLFVTVGVALFLHGAAAGRGSAAPRRDWNAVALGAVSVLAMRSKEVGAVLLALPLLFAIAPNGRFDGRRFLRRTAHWLAGALAILAALVLLDLAILGDAGFSFDPGRREALREMNFPDSVGSREADWRGVVWGQFEMRVLWIGVVVAAVAAGVRRRALHLRLLHLLPIAYLLALVVLYVWLPHPVSARMLIAVVPTACLMCGALLHDFGLDDVAWSRMLRPRGVLLAGTAVAFAFLVVAPLQRGELDLATLLPEPYLSRLGWDPQQFARAVLVPVAVGLAASLVALAAGSAPRRLAALGVAFVFLFAPGVETTRRSLSHRWARQRGELLVYPWKAFRSELDAHGATHVTLSSDLRSYYGMSGRTRHSLARLALRRPDVYVDLSDHVPLESPWAIASRSAYREWLRALPTLEETAIVGPGGFLVLTRPREAADRLRIGGSAAPETGAGTGATRTVEERLDEARGSRDAASRRELVDWLVSHPLGTRPSATDDLVELGDSGLRAVALYPDGWTRGTSPAGVLVENRSPSPATRSLRLSVGDDSRPLPVDVFVDDGERIETVRFEEVTSRSVVLSPVPPFGRALFVIWTDGAWTPPAGDERALGVHLDATGES